MTIEVNKQTLQELRHDSSAEKCVEALFESVTKMAKAIGVNVSWTLDSVEETPVDQSAIADEFGRLSAIVGVIAAGARFNPIQYTKDRDDAAKLQRESPQHFYTPQKDDKEATGGESGPAADADAGS